MNKLVYNKVKNLKEKKKQYVNTGWNVGYNASKAEFKIFEEYFNKMLGNNAMIKEDGIRPLYQILNNHVNIVSKFDIIGNSQNLASGVTVVFEFKGVEYFMRFYTFKNPNSGGLNYEIGISTHTKTTYGFSFIFKYLYFLAILRSDVKGSFVTFKSGSSGWEKTDLESRDFNDIFLPDEILEDLVLFCDIYKDRKELQRLLMVGHPGTGKTEASLVLANELKKMGVTIFKTPIDKLFKFKVELAEILGPTIIILDDLDIALGGRNGGGFSELLGVFLDVLDGTNKISKKVGILATTNASQILDLAAQRPGRFHKTLIFDNLTKDNIRDIIYKSLDKNFNLKKTNKATQLYVANEIIEKIHKAKLTGAHVYNLTEQMRLKFEVGKKEVNLKELVKYIDNELASLDKLKNNNYLERTLTPESSGTGMGFQQGITELR